MMKFFLFLPFLAVFNTACKKKEVDIDCKFHYESTFNEGNYIEKDTSSSFLGKTTMYFKLKIEKRIIDAGICNFGHAPECSVQWTISNLSGKDIVFTYQNQYIQSILSGKTIDAYYPLGNGNACLLTIKELNDSIQVKYK